MVDEKYVLKCPTCGRVEGYIASPVALDDDDDGLVADMVIEQRVVKTPTGTETRFQCPRCGRWLRSDAARPA